MNEELTVGYDKMKNQYFIDRSKSGKTNFQKGTQDGDTTNKTKVWIYQPSAGAGFKIKNIMIDYAFTNLANQNNPLYTHIFSLRFNIAGRKEIE